MSVREPDAAEAGNTKAQATSGERTDTGIYAGVEKYTKEDHPEHNVAYDAATGRNTGAGVPPDSTKTGRHHDETARKRSSVTNQAAETGIGAAPPDEYVRAVLHPAPAPSAQHLIDTYPHLYPEIEKQEAQRKAREAKEAAEKEAKKQDTDEKPESGVLHEKIQIFDGDAKVAEREAIVTEREAADHLSGVHHEHHHHHGIGHALAHVLHLDRAERKEKHHAKDRLDEEMEAYRERVLQNIDPRERSGPEMRRMSVTSNCSTLKPTETVGHTEEAAWGGADASAGGAVSNSRQSDTIPLGILNPEGLKKKQEEDEILKSGGDYLHLDQREAAGETVPSDRVNQLVEAARQKKEAGLLVHSEVDPKDFQVNFHTADAFETLDRTAH